MNKLPFALAVVAGLLSCDKPSAPAITPVAVAPEGPPPLGGVRFLPDTQPISCATMPVAPLPDPGLPWDDIDSFCESAPRGEVWAEAAPPDDWDQLNVRNAYGERVHQFMWGRKYRATDADDAPGLGWLRDARWRLSGNYVGCPDEEGSYKGTHLWVRVYYSPEVVDWMCEHRRTDPGSADPAELPVGSVIIKEMHGTVPEDLRVVEGSTSTLWIDADYDSELTWLYMIKGDDTHDGWFWGELESPVEGEPTTNLPIVNRSGAARVPFPEPGDSTWDDFVASGGEDWQPTGNSKKSVVYPSEQFGNYCIRCHASAESEATFSSILNILGQEPGYPVIAPAPDATPVNLGQHLKEQDSTLCAKEGFGCFPEALPDGQPSAGFEQTFPQFAGTKLADVWGHRLPSQTWDHVPPEHGGPDGFVSSDQCIVCHDSNGAGNMRVTVAGDEPGSTVQLGLTPWAEWSASPMGLAGRDPIFFAQLESERNRLTSEGWEEDKIECVQNLCLHCHGVMGQRQHLDDTPDQAQASLDLCAEILPEPEMMNTTFGGGLFTRDMVDAWPGDSSAQASEYGGLARDGISCAVCHRMNDEGLGEERSYTGNFQVGPADELYGPFDDVLEHPMEEALGITPKVGEVIKSSEMCGSCHAVLLPVFSNEGELREESEEHPEGAYSYEQATYLEWLNSRFNPDAPAANGGEGQTCQDCHMPHTFTTRGGQEQDLNFWMANIQDDSYPESEFSLQDELVLKEREGYRRHVFYGLNLFVNAYFQQFPLLLGERQVAPTSGSALPPLLNAMDEGLKFARTQTARVAIGEPTRSEPSPEEAVMAFDVTVQNLGGHNLPSGVGFRRLFLEVQVKDAAGGLLWASGRTNNLGLILDGVGTEPLPTEIFRAEGEQPYQPHHTTIKSGDQVQIYEELNQDSAGRFTTSFIHRWEDIKDNRLRPAGWRWDHEYAQLMKPRGVDGDPDYTGEQLTGADTTRYELTLPPEVMARAATVTARLYSQATPPSFLNQRFEWAAQGPHSADTQRLYYMAGHLNTAAESNFETSALELSGTYIEDWRLLVTGAERSL